MPHWASALVSCYAAGMNKPSFIGQGSDSRGLAPFTAGDFERLLIAGAFSDIRVELAGGVLEKMMPAHLAHGETHSTLAARLHGCFAGTPWLLALDLAVRIDDDTVRAIDIAAVAADAPRQGLTTADAVLLAVEIADTTLDRDLGDKRLDYAAAGIPHYWVADIVGRRLIVHRDPVDGDYADVRTLAFDDAVAVPGTGHSVAVG